MRRRIGIGVPVLGGLIALLFGVTTALGGHNGAEVSSLTGDCGETTFTAQVIDPDGTHLVANMRLVVHADGDTQVTAPIPTDGSTVELTAGPFFDSPAETKTIMWRVFGGGERDYDQPLWNGHGEPGFTDDINAYAAEHGFGFVVAGPDDPNPFTTWNEFDVEGCQLDPAAKDDCKDGGWADFGFRNQGQCIRFVNTGQDSR